MKSLTLLLLVVACGAPRTPTSGGLVVKYQPNEKRLSPEKARELDARHKALLECLPPEVICRERPPTFSIEGNCDTFVDRGEPGQKGVYVSAGMSTGHIILPGSLGAAAHEMTHHYACETHPHPDYDASWMSRCGDTIDGAFRRLYPPVVCPSDPAKGTVP